MNNLRGIILIIFAMAGFTIEDALIKDLSRSISVGQILALVGLGGTAVFVTVSRVQRHRLFTRAAWRPIFLVRAICEGFAPMFFVTGLAHLDLSVVASVFQSTPLVMTMGAALFLRETVGWRRWCAIFTGFAGVLLIIRPGLDGFEPMALVVLGAVISVAARDLLTRRMNAEVSSSIISAQGFAAMVPAGLLMMLLGGQEATSMDGTKALICIAAIGFGTAAYYCIVTAMRIAEVSVVTPFRYTRLLFSLLIGVIAFGERPDLPTLAGAGMILAAGLYTIWREHSLMRG